MDVQIIKDELVTLPLISELPSDEEIQKFVNLAELVLSIYFNFDEEFISSEYYITAICLEVAHLIENTPFEDVLKMYNYLSSFSVAGAITGTVASKSMKMIGNLVKDYLASFDYFIETDDGNSITYGYAKF